ncbi:hypothetical protein ACVXG7_10900 [Enterobacter hormaechei]
MISVANGIAEAGFDPQGRTSEDLLDLAESASLKSPKAVRIKRRPEKHRRCARRHRCTY